MYTSVASTVHSGMYESVEEASLHSVHSPSQDSALTTQSDPVQVAVLTGRQELRLKIKMSDNVPGPKVVLVLDYPNSWAQLFKALLGKQAH